MSWSWCDKDTKTKMAIKPSISSEWASKYKMSRQTKQSQIEPSCSGC